jgi:hypothetical protein
MNGGHLAPGADSTWSCRLARRFRPPKLAGGEPAVDAAPGKGARLGLTLPAEPLSAGSTSDPPIAGVDGPCAFW